MKMKTIISQAEFFYLKMASCSFLSIKILEPDITCNQCCIGRKPKSTILKSDPGQHQPDPQPCPVSMTTVFCIYLSTPGKAVTFDLLYLLPRQRSGMRASQHGQPQSNIPANGCSYFTSSSLQSRYLTGELTKGLSFDMWYPSSSILRIWSDFDVCDVQSIYTRYVLGEQQGYYQLKVMF